MRLIVGLGNPGPPYARTRHNVGAMAVERAAARWGIALRGGQGVRSGRGSMQAGPVALAGPVAWMNESGPAVKAQLAQLELSPDHLIVLHDDLDLPPARVRIRQAGGAGGHNGILSLLTALDTSEFCRIKIGIGRPAPELDPADYVLAPFTSEEWPVIDEALEQAVMALECVLTDGVAIAMNRFNVRGPKEEEPGQTD